MDIFCPSYIMDMKVYRSKYSNTKYQGEAAKLYINQKNGTFKAIELPILHQNFLAMGLNFEDVNKDGYQDLYMGTGFPDLASVVPNTLLINHSSKNLKDMSSTSGTAHLQKGHSISFFDYEKDGDLDIYASMGGFYSVDQFQNSFFQNLGNSNNWINVKLIGVQDNTSAIGSRIEICLDDAWTEKIFREINSGGSYGSSPLEKLIGIGEYNRIAYLKIRWRNGQEQVIINPSINTNHTIIQDSN